MGELNVSLLEPDIGGVVGFDHLLQRNGQLLPAFLRVLPQFLDGGKDHHGFLHGGINVDHPWHLGSLL